MRSSTGPNSLFFRGFEPWVLGVASHDQPGLIFESSGWGAFQQSASSRGRKALIGAIEAVMAPGARTLRRSFAPLAKGRGCRSTWFQAGHAKQKLALGTQTTDPRSPTHNHRHPRRVPGLLAIKGAIVAMGRQKKIVETIVDDGGADCARALNAIRQALRKPAWSSGSTSSSRRNSQDVSTSKTTRQSDGGRALRPGEVFAMRRYRQPQATQ